MLIPEIYVLWHPQNPFGEPLARRILQWLRPGNGLGPEVFYRCLPEEPGAGLFGLPPPLPGETRAATTVRQSNPGKVSNFQIVLPLIEENMVAEMSWRYWLEQLAEAPADTRVIMPIALDATAYNMPDRIRELNYLRPTGTSSSAEPTWTSMPPESTVRSLLKQITEAMCRLLLPRSGSASIDGLPKVNVFLSHTKQDGAGPARRLRDYIYSQTQLTAFFDENDIAFGASFARIIKRSLDSTDTAALISVRSAQYASRPWCRREFSLFRQPRRETPDDSIVERWRLYPSLVVEAMEGRLISQSIPEAGNCPTIRWTEQDSGMEELIVTSIIRDAMLASFHSRLGQTLASQANQIVINWLPDPTTLLHIPRVRRGDPVDVIYPGRGLSYMDLLTLREFFPSVTFRAYEGMQS